MDTLLLIDGHNLLFKSFYGMPERLLPGGKPVHGIIGFIVITRKIIRDTEPTHVLVVFDPEEEPSRTAIYEGYKSNRRDFGGLPDRENPFSQLADIKKALDYMNIRHIEQAGYEADDMIASLAAYFGCRITIVSTDTDFFQLIDDRVNVLRYHGKRSVLFDVAMVRERFGVLPSEFIDYKSLVGDKSDNIQGVRGIGPKTAVKVLKGERALNAEEREILERNRKIIKLDTGATCPFSLPELSLHSSFEGFKLGDCLRHLEIM